MPDIFTFENVGDFLNNQLIAIQKKNPRYSARAWAKKLGLASPATLTRILKGQRTPSPEMTEKIADGLGLSSEQKSQLQMLGELGKIRNSELRAQYLRIYKSAGKAQNTMDWQSFEIFSHWAFAPVLQLLTLPEISENPDLILKRLGPKLSRQELQQILETLEKNKLIISTKNGFKKNNSNTLKMHSDVFKASIENFLAEQIKVSQVAAKKLKVGRRKLSSASLSFQKKDIQAAKEIIDQAVAQLVDLSSESKAETVYQFNAQFFELLDWE